MDVCGIFTLIPVKPTEGLCAPVDFTEEQWAYARAASGAEQVKAEEKVCHEVEECEPS